MKFIKSAAAVLCLLSGGALADDFYIDRFEITRDGISGWFVDEFDDGLVPPSTEGTFPGGSAASYGTRPSVLLGPEASGRLLLDPLLGEATDTDESDGTILIQRARLLTDTSDDPADADLGLKAGHTFDVIGTFDLVRPQTTDARYGIRISDLGTAAPDNLIQLRVELLQGDAWVLRFAQSGDDETSFLEIAQVDLGGIADVADYEQIVLTLTKADAASNQITASFVLVDADAVLAPVQRVLDGSATAFDGETWTRAAFFASVYQGPPVFTKLVPLITPLILAD